jgi:hypothetical protein
MTEEEQLGVRAIQHLQSIAGIEESDEDALEGWLAMSNDEQEFTIMMANIPPEVLSVMHDQLGSHNVS